MVDLARILGNIHTAEYQYIPALALPKERELKLRLNNPPSFRKPKSVLVAALPAVEASQLPPLRAVAPGEISCLQKAPLVLGVEGAPLAFATDLRTISCCTLNRSPERASICPRSPIPRAADFTWTPKSCTPASSIRKRRATCAVTGALKLSLARRSICARAHVADWTVPAADQSALIVGRDDAIHLQSPAAACVEKITAVGATGADLKTTWKLGAKPDELEVEVR